MLELVRRLWTGEPVTHHGETCRLDAVRMNIRPVQRPSPPVWVAANNDNAIRRAAHIGDTWMVNPHSTTATIRRQLVLYREALDAAGKPFPGELPCIKEVFCAKDRKTAVETAGPYLLAKYRDYASWGQDAAMPDDESFDQEFDDLLRDRFILGLARGVLRAAPALHRGARGQPTSSSEPTGQACRSRPRSRACGSSPDELLPELRKP